MSGVPQVFLDASPYVSNRCNHHRRRSTKRNRLWNTHSVYVCPDPASLLITGREPFSLPWRLQLLHTAFWIRHLKFREIRGKRLENTHINRRYIEIDLVRGIAVVMMVLYHLLFDLWFLSMYQIPVTTGFWKYFAVATASLFLILVGISVTISAAHAEKLLSRRDFYLKFVRRGIVILLVAAGITFATWWYLSGEGFIIFGILHLIGFSIILAPLFFHRGKKTLVAGIVIILIGILLMQGTWSGLPDSIRDFSRIVL